MAYIPTYQFVDVSTNASVSPNPLVEAGSHIIVTGFNNPQTLLTIILVGLLVIFFIAWGMKLTNR